MQCLSHFSPDRPRILVQLSRTDVIALYQPQQLPLPRSGASFRSVKLMPAVCQLFASCSSAVRQLFASCSSSVRQLCASCCVPPASRQ